ncbi:peroxidase 64 [Quercus suber]|uniref:peroxidase n=1 Tax=Quercus suber TaxID=58331 RepID=A0AAW0LZL8_QUESU
MAATLVSLALSILFISSSVNALSLNYYDKTCPHLESAVTDAVKYGIVNDKTVPAALLRMHFHDCFIRGCDASVLLDSKGNQTAEKDGPPNISLHAFYVIDNAKKAVEELCPGVVSCADILALAARDAVALVRGHTLGFAHCSSFENRIHNFNGSVDIDPSLKSTFAATLRSICPEHNKVRSAGTTLDSTTTAFDNAYYKLLLKGKSIFSSDEALLSTPKTKALVSKFASSQEEFDKAFVKSMIKMSSLAGGQEIRLDCRRVR